MITRDELRHMSKAYFSLSMELVRDVVKALEEEMMDNFDDEGRKPVSAAFTAPIPSESSGPPREKGDAIVEMREEREHHADPRDHGNLLSPTHPATQTHHAAHVSFPAMQAVSQEAIDEIVERTFASADLDGDGMLSYEEFARFAENDSTLVGWFEALGSVF
jgi:hypothetical protein